MAKKKESAKTTKKKTPVATAKATALKEAKEANQAKAAAKKAKAKSVEADAKAKKEVAEAKSAAKKAYDVEQSSKKAAANKKFEDIEGFRRSAISQVWTREALINQAKSLFGEGVSVEEFNIKQIAFTIGKKRVPEEGYFSVN